MHYSKDLQDNLKIPNHKNLFPIFFSSLAVLLFLVVALIFPLRDKISKLLYPKPSSNAALNGGIFSPTVYSKPIIEWGNSSYHDSMGARDPYIMTYNRSYYLYYDCTEDLLNPSFESNLGTNGWDQYHASLTPSSDHTKFGTQSLKVITDGTVGAGAYTGNYFYNYIEGQSPANNPNNLASPTGLEVLPGVTYVASAWVWATPGTPIQLVVQQYRDDPFYFNNVIPSTSSPLQYIAKPDTGTANGTWQWVHVKFTSDPSATAITLSLASSQGGPATISYWDGVELERRTNGTDLAASDFPTNIDFNKKIEETVGWKACVATSQDGINFTKLGLVGFDSTTTTAKEKYEQPGSVGTSFAYPEIFPSNGSWYGNTWSDGYPVLPISPFNSITNPPYIYKVLGAFTGQLDQGAQFRRVAYIDYRVGGNESGNYARSGLVKSANPIGGFTHISFPAIEAPNFPGIISDPNSCAQPIRNSNTPFGCDYIAANGIPMFYPPIGKWVLFLSGQTLHSQNIWENTTGIETLVGGIRYYYYSINAGYATSSSATGPWTPYTGNPIISARDIPISGAVEGPSVFYDGMSKNYVMFWNAISGGNTAPLRAFWTTNPLTTWPTTPMQTVIKTATNSASPNYTNIPWSIPGVQATAGLSSPIISLTNDKQLNLYFATRTYNPPATRSFLFHDIGLAIMGLPLLPPISTSFPTADIHGPLSGTAGQTLTYTINAYDTDGALQTADILYTTTNFALPTGCASGTGNWCYIARGVQLSGNQSSISGSLTPLAGSYYISANVYNTNGNKCTSNPWQPQPEWSYCGNASWTTVNIGGGSAITGNVISSAPSCTVDSSGFCKVNITGMYANLPNAEVCVSDSQTNTLVSFMGIFNPSGSSADAPWIKANTKYTFSLRSSVGSCTGAIISQTVVTGLASPTPTSTPIPTFTPTPIPIPTNTPTITPTPPLGGGPTNTPTPVQPTVTATPTFILTPSPTLFLPTSTPTLSPVPTLTPTFTPTPTPTRTPTPTPIPPTNTPTPTRTPTPTPVIIPGDGNNDGVVNLIDLSMLLSNFNLTVNASNRVLDLNNDQKINTFDFQQIVAILSSNGTINIP